MTNRMNYVSSVAVLVVSFLSPAASAQEHKLMLDPGLWEVKTMTGTMGMPADLPPVPMTRTVCLSDEMVNTTTALPALSGAKGDCRVVSTENTEGVAYWKMICIEGGQEMKANAELHLASNQRYVGKIYFEKDRKHHGQPMNGHSTVEGEWKGGCEQPIQTVKHHSREQKATN